MRILPAFLALAVVAASAGCMGGDESSSDPTPTPAAAATPPSTEAPPASPAPAATPAPTAPEATPPATSAASEEPAPATPAKELYNASFDFASQGDPTGQSAKSFQTQPALAGHASVFVNVTLTRSSTTPTMVPVSGTLNSPTVRVLDPDGREAAAIASEGATSVQVPAKPGAWTVRYEGAGTLRASVSLVAVA